MGLWLYFTHWYVRLCWLLPFYFFFLPPTLNSTVWCIFCISCCYSKPRNHVILSWIWINNNEVVTYVVYFSLFSLQLGQRLSKKYPLKNIYGDLQKWKGFQYFMLQTMCRKLFIAYPFALDRHCVIKLSS